MATAFSKFGASITNFIIEILVFFEGFQILEGDFSDFFESIACEEGLMRGHNNVIEADEVHELIILNNFIRVIFEEDFAFFFVDVESGTANEPGFNTFDE